MKLITRDGRLTLGSAYKLFVVGWSLGVGALFTAIFWLVAFAAIASGETASHRCRRSCSVGCWYLGCRSIVAGDLSRCFRLSLTPRCHPGFRGTRKTGTQ